MIDISTSCRITMDRVLRDALVTAQDRSEAVLLSWTEPVADRDTLAFFARGRLVTSQCFYWDRPDDDFSIAGVGCARALIAESGCRFQELDRAWHDLLQRELLDAGSLDVPGTGPLAMGGFGFDPRVPATDVWTGFPAGRLVLPRYMLAVTGDGSWLTVNLLISPTDDATVQLVQLERDLCRLRTVRLPYSGQLNGGSAGHVSKKSDAPTRVDDVRSASSWKEVVGAARDVIRSSAAEKIVLARAVHAQSEVPFDPVHGLERLRNIYPECTLFAIAEDGRTFLGATPERLVRLRNGTVDVDCIAGTIGRGADEQSDRQLALQLLASPKDLNEHSVVLRTLLQQLSQSCTDLQAPAEPDILRLRNVQHLCTPITGRLSRQQSILSLVDILHPSPAVGGLPHEAALRFLRDREDLDRGWYAAPVGWIDRKGEGDFAVAIRSALLSGSEAVLFAGCGIMADSDPDAEYDESCLKLQTMLSILGGATR